MTQSEAEERVCLLMLEVHWPEDEAFAVMDYIEESRFTRAMTHVWIMLEKHGPGDAEELQQLVRLWQNGQLLG